MVDIVFRSIETEDAEVAAVTLACSSVSTFLLIADMRTSLESHPQHLKTKWNISCN